MTHSNLEVTRYQVLCSLADIYCNMSLLDIAYEILTLEIEAQRRISTQKKAIGRLLVASIYADLKQFLYPNVERTFQEVKGNFSKLSNLNVSNQLLHVHALVASAQTSYYSFLFYKAITR